MGYGDDHHPDLAHPLQAGMTTCFNFEQVPELKEKVLLEVEMDKECKDTNPKDAVGIKKAPISTVSGPVMLELGLAMLEGARKYGRHNYRVSGIRTSVYVDATFRHLIKFWEGEDVDPDSGLSHVTKAIASLMVLRDAMIFDKWTDDRPPALPNSNEYWTKLNELAAKIIKQYPEAVNPFTQAGLLKFHLNPAIGCEKSEDGE